MKLLLAGVTGQLGAGLVEAADPELVKLIPLVRPIGTRTASRRLEALYPDRPELAAEALEGDVRQPRWGLDAATVRRLAAEVDAVVNVAGETNWAATRRQLDTVNVIGAVHGYELTRELQRAGGRQEMLYCYASSIHVAGGAMGRIAEIPLGPDPRRTSYELSKWVGELALLDPIRRREGPALCIARIGGLVGSSRTGATRHRNSLYMLADRLGETPLGLFPLGRRGRVDMLPRDIAGQLLLDVVAALHARPTGEPEIVHACAGESAPLTEVVLRALDSLDVADHRARPRVARVPDGGLLWVSEHLARYQRIPAGWQNALIGLRYLTLDRLFERARLASLAPMPLPGVSIEQLVRLAFEIPAPASLPAPGALSLARFHG